MAVARVREPGSRRDRNHPQRAHRRKRTEQRHADGVDGIRRRARRLPGRPLGSTVLVAQPIMRATEIATKPKDNPWEMALRQFHRAADLLPLKRGIREFLVQPHRELTVNFPIHMDDGTVKVFTGYRVHHSTVLGPTKGGIRYNP